MAAPLIGMAVRAAAKKIAQKKAKAKANPKDKMLDRALVGLSGAKAAGATGMAMREEGRRAEKKDRSDEATAETKRESRGMKSGGYVRAADGCAKKGKTKGKMR